MQARYLWSYLNKINQSNPSYPVGREDNGKVHEPPQDRGLGYHRPTKAPARVLQTSTTR